MSRYLLKELEDKFNELEIQQEEDELDEWEENDEN